MTKRFISLGFAVELFCSTAIILAQEQAAAPVHKEGDTWQFNITRKGQVASSTEQLAGTYELVFSQGKIKLYEVSGSQKTELEIVPNNEGLLSLVGKREQREGVRRRGQRRGQAKGSDFDFMACPDESLS